MLPPRSPIKSLRRAPAEPVPLQLDSNWRASRNRPAELTIDVTSMAFARGTHEDDARSVTSDDSSIWSSDAYDRSEYDAYEVRPVQFFLV